jgi:transposase
MTDILILMEEKTMPWLLPRLLHLKETERTELNQLVNRHTTPQQIALRAKIILLADAGLSHRHIASELKISRDMARQWRDRWLDTAEKEIPLVQRLQDAPRPGAPATFTAEQLTHLFAIACEDPTQSARPISHWTASELALELQKRGIVEEISPRHVRRLLAEASLKPHQIRYWLTPPSDDLFFSSPGEGNLRIVPHRRRTRSTRGTNH